MKTTLSETQLRKITVLADDGESITLAVIRALPDATESDIDREITRVYDSMEF